MTQNVNVTYNLSAAGQKAALIAGRCASATVTETMTLEDPALIEALAIGADGSLSLDARWSPGMQWGPSESHLSLGVPPASLSHLIFAYRSHCAAWKTACAVKEAKELAAKQAAEQATAAQLAQDAPLVESMIAALEATDLLTPIPANTRCDFYCELYADSPRRTLLMTPEQTNRMIAVRQARENAATEAAAAKKAAIQAEREAMIAEHGGYLWRPEAGMCDFAGMGLWLSGQSKRWVGIFTNSRGIASFLDSPRGEHTFEISGLSAGDCIQGGGFDTNSRGRRRNESEFFGVVVRNDDSGLVVKIVETRTAAFAASKKLLKAA